VIGLTLADVGEKEILKWQKILKEIGILFQIKDDFLGTFGEEKLIGKPINSDLKEGKRTLIVEEFLKRCSGKEKERFYSFFGKRQLNQLDFLWYENLLFKYKIFNELRRHIIKKSKDIKTELYSYFPKKTLTKLLVEILNKIGDFYDKLIIKSAPIRDGRLV
jgi:geranylgeranyl pyrophosphate synthase